MKAKPTIQCPYSVQAANDIFLQGVKAGLAAAMEYTGSKRDEPKIGKHIEVIMPERNRTLDAMLGSKN